MKMWIQVVVVMAVGCSSPLEPLGGKQEPKAKTTDPPPTHADEPAAPDPTPPGCTTCYYRDVQPLLERSCHGCHVEGGAAPFAFTAPEDAQGFAPAMLDALERGVMPPYFADQSCRPTRDDPRFTDAEMSLFRSWVDEGAPLGDPAQARHAPVLALPTVEPDLLFDIGVDFDVATESTGPDDVDIYRCFDVDLGLAADTVVTGYDVVPGNNAVVHHLLGYYVPPQDLAQLQNNDAADPGPGYNCEDLGPNVSDSMFHMTLSWVPGAIPSKFPTGTGITIPAGSHMVVQIHYNTLSAADGDTVDRTSFFFETAPAGPSSDLTPLHIIPATNFDFVIAANDPNSVQVNVLGGLVDWDFWSLVHGMVFQNTRVFAATGHLHTFATKVRLDVIRPDDSEECIFNNDPWDFHWQRSYSLVEPFDIGPNDRLKLTCVFDNSQENQPYINGVQIESREVRWGERTVDEMCMIYLTFIDL